MASTNKTQNLELSQFLGTDKPAWLADYNSDMEKIDRAFEELSLDVSNIPNIKEELEQADESLSGRIDNVNNKIADMELVNEQEAQALVTLKNNYETMHHEMVLTAEKVSENSADIETLMNSASGAYSTVEREVGTWIDGRPLYEISFNAPITFLSNDGNTKATYKYEFDKNIDSIIDISGLVTATSTDGKKYSFGINSTLMHSDCGIRITSGFSYDHTIGKFLLIVMVRQGEYTPLNIMGSIRYLKK